VVYQDSDLPAKKLDLERNAGDCINTQVNGGANGLIHIHRGMRFRVHGFLQPRDFREGFGKFIYKVRKSKNCADLTMLYHCMRFETNPGIHRPKRGRGSRHAHYYVGCCIRARK